MSDQQRFDINLTSIWHSFHHRRSARTCIDEAPS